VYVLIYNLFYEYLATALRALPEVRPALTFSIISLAACEPFFGAELVFFLGALFGLEPFTYLPDFGAPLQFLLLKQQSVIFNKCLHF
jgi:hypothetical protein